MNDGQNSMIIDQEDWLDLRFQFKSPTVAILPSLGVVDYNDSIPQDQRRCG